MAKAGFEDGFWCPFDVGECMKEIRRARRCIDGVRDGILI
jgi:hypothetical protein